MMEKEQFDPWLQAAIGYITPAAQGLRVEPDLDGRPEAHAVPRLREEHAPTGYAGKLGYASAGRWRTSSS
jgi:multiple sugar transport system substrate-binding protein